MSSFKSALDCAAALRAPGVASRAWITTETREVPFSALADRIGRVAALAGQRGLKVGDRVVVATQDDCEASLLFVALICNGLTVVLLDSLTGPERARALIAKADPSLIIVDSSLAARWDLASVDVGVIEIAAPRAKAGLFGGLSRAKPAEGLHALLDTLPPESPPETIAPETLAFILFTSGTTREPKGVCISHRALFSHLATLSQAYGYSDKSRILNTLMLSHADGSVQGPMIAFFNTASLFRPVKFEITTIEKLLDAVFQLRITHMVSVPTMMALMARLSDHQDDAFAGEDFQLMISCGAALEPHLWQEFELKFGVKIINLYGLTETVAGGVFAGPGVPACKLGSIGRPIDCELKIDDEGGGRGELLIRGDLLMSGYFDDRAQTDEVMRDGWFHTGDIARVDDDGWYWICGRKKNIIIRGGLNINPEEIIEVLNRNPKVEDAVAFGAPDPEWGEKVYALVVSTTATETDLLEYCAEVLEPRKIPSAIRIVDALPKGRSGKVMIEDARALFDASQERQHQKAAVGDTEERLLQLAAATFKVDLAKVRLASTPNDILGWDSLAHLQFVTAIEEEFGCNLTPRQIMSLSRVGKALDFLEER